MLSTTNFNPIVDHIEWHGNTCTVGETNFSVRVNPDGLEAIFSIDSNISARPMFDHTESVQVYLRRNNMPHNALFTVEGFRYTYAWLMAQNQYIGPLFLYDIHCREDSDLIGWFLVLGVKDERLNR